VDRIRKNPEVWTGSKSELEKIGFGSRTVIKTAFVKKRRSITKKTYIQLFILENLLSDIQVPGYI
jgi:hypothetical protein